MKIKFTGKSEVSFENGSIYECEGPREDTLPGIWYDIKDESGEWYMYQDEFVKNNFEGI